MRMRAPEVKAIEVRSSATRDSPASALYAFLFPKHAQTGKVYPIVNGRGRTADPAAGPSRPSTIALFATGAVATAAAGAARGAEHGGAVIRSPGRDDRRPEQF